MVRLRVGILVVGVVGVVGSACGRPPAVVATPASSTRVQRLESDLRALSADSMMGRETGTEGAAMAARFLARRVAELGLEPAGDSLYVQRVPLVRVRVTPNTELVVTVNDSVHRLRLGEDFAPLLTLGEGAPEPRRRAEGELVFAGYVRTTPPNDDLRGLSIAGRVAVVVHGAPPGVSGADSAALTTQAALSERIGRIVALRPAAIIVVMTGSMTQFYRQLLPSLLRDVRPPDSREVRSEADRALPPILFAFARPGSPLVPSTWPTRLGSSHMAERRARITIDVAYEAFTGLNVAAMVSGSDPVLRRSVVAFGAHYDHIGVLPAQGGDSIANGADDDGSGSVALLELARAMKTNPPRRSTLFVWHVGEEKGLLGSTYFVEHPPVPIDSVVAMLNADMIGRGARDSLYIVGPRAAPDGSSRWLGAIVDSVNAGRFIFNREWDDAAHPEQIYQRSDHYNYAKLGVPIVFFTSGMHGDYHDVTDDVSRMDFAKLAAVVDLIESVGRAVANDSRGRRRP